MDISMYKGDLLILSGNEFERSVLEDMFQNGCETVLERDCFTHVFAIYLRRKTAADSGAGANSTQPAKVSIPLDTAYLALQ